MTLQQFLEVIHFEGAIRVYHYRTREEGGSIDYIKSSTKRELFYGDDSTNEEIFFYRKLLANKEIAYASLTLNDERLELWIATKED